MRQNKIKSVYKIYLGEFKWERIGDNVLCTPVGNEPYRYVLVQQICDTAKKALCKAYWFYNPFLYIEDEKGNIVYKREHNNEIINLLKE
jgi:hypothetical protein